MVPLETDPDKVSEEGLVLKIDMAAIIIGIVTIIKIVIRMTNVNAPKESPPPHDVGIAPLLIFLLKLHKRTYFLLES